MGCGKSKTKDEEEEEDGNSNNKSISEEERKKQEEEEERKRQEEEQDRKERKKNRKKRKKGKNGKLQRELSFDHHEEEDENNLCEYAIGYEDEIYNNINYGKPIRIHRQTWLTHNCEVIPDTTCPKVYCPPGWRIPTLKDYFMLIASCGGIEKACQVMLDPQKLRMDRNLVYITSTKCCSDQFRGLDNDSWEFKCIAFDRNDEKIAEENEEIDKFAAQLAKLKEEYREKTIEKKENKDGTESQEIKDAEIQESDFVKQIQSELKRNNELAVVPFIKDNEHKMPTVDHQEKKVLRGFIIGDRPIDVGFFKKNETNKTSQVTYINRIPNDTDNQNQNNPLNNNDKPTNYPDSLNDNPGNPFQNGEMINMVPNAIMRIFDLNTFKNKNILSCKLIADEVIGVDFISPLVGEQSFRVIFEIPKLYNITTFEWNFGDNSPLKGNNSLTSKKRVAFHIFHEKGEYNVQLRLSLFSLRRFTFEKKVWIIDEIEYGKNEIIDGINYGVPIKLGNQVWLSQDLEYYKDFKLDEIDLQRGKGPGKNGENSYIDSVASCPPGWRLPYREEFEQLLKYAGRNDAQKLYFFTMEEGFNAKINEYGIYDAICIDFKDFRKYNVTNSIQTDRQNFKEMLGNMNNKSIFENSAQNKPTRAEEINIEILDPKFLHKLKNYDKIIIRSLNFRDIFNKDAFCLRIENNKCLISTRSTSVCSAMSYFSTRCIAEESFDLDLGLLDDSYPINTKIQFLVEHPNILSYEWDFGVGGVDEALLRDETKAERDDDDVEKKNKKKKKIRKKKKTTAEKEKEDEEIKNNENNSRIKNPWFSYSVPGEYEVTCKLTLFGNRINIIKKTLFIHMFHEAGEVTQFTGCQQIKVLHLGIKYKVKRNDLIHFSNQCAPMCPLIKDIGFYIAFHDMTDHLMKCFKVKFNEGRESLMSYFDSPFYTLDFGVPVDIVASKSGLVLLLKDLRDENTLYIHHINDEGQVLFRNNIMQNGSYPIRAEFNQLLFVEPDTERPVFGMNAMHKPFSGRLSYGSGRILVIFSYMNYFGSSNGERDDNCADSIISYSEDGSEVHLVSNWCTSHSLCQRSVFDGRFFYTAALGDAGPSNVKILRIDPNIKVKLMKKEDHIVHRRDESQLNRIEPDLKFDHYFPLQNKIRDNNELIQAKDADFNQADFLNNLENFKKSELMTMHLRHDFLFANALEGSVPGDLRGKSCGRLGDLTVINPNRIAMIYSRIPCIDAGDVNDKNEFGCLIFNNQLKICNQAFYRKGDLISCIKQTRYGENIFIMYSETNKFSNGNKYIIDFVTVAEECLNPYDKPCCACLINQIGQKISILHEIPICLFSPPDDFETMVDGSAFWIFIDDENNLNICFLFTNTTLNNSAQYLKDFIPGDKYSEGVKGRIHQEWDRLYKLEQERFKELGVENEDDKVKKQKEWEEKMKKEYEEEEIRKEQLKLEDEIQKEQKKQEKEIPSLMNQEFGMTNSAGKRFTGELPEFHIQYGIPRAKKHSKQSHYYM